MPLGDSFEQHAMGDILCGLYSYSGNNTLGGLFWGPTHPSSKYESTLLEILSFVYKVPLHEETTAL